MSKSNIIINGPHRFTDLNLDNKRIYHTLFQTFGLNNKKLSFKDGDDKTIFYNHITQKESSAIPSKLCIGDECLERKHLSMINGNNTIKLKQGSDNQYLQPISVHYGGDGNDDQCEDCSPKSQYFYNLSNIGTPKCNNKLNQTGLVKKYNMFKRFGIQAPNGQFLRAYANGGIGLSPTMGPWETFTVGWPYNIWFFEPFILKKDSYMSGPLGLKSNFNKYLCNEKHWWHGCLHLATWNRSRVGSWERMSFIRAFETNSEDLLVYIFSHNCGKVLSIQNYVHFSSSLNNDYCKFRLIPVYDKCSEDCKSDYLSTSACCGSKETDISKELSCPRDRPKCRFYDERSGTLGKCFKEETKDNNGIPVFNQNDPHHCKFATANNSGFMDQSDASNISENDTMFNEYTISMAKNEKDQLYESDIIKHIHDHSELLHSDTSGTTDDPGIKDIREDVASEYGPSWDDDETFFSRVGI